MMEDTRKCPLVMCVVPTMYSVVAVSMEEHSVSQVSMQRMQRNVPSSLWERKRRAEISA